MKSISYLIVTALIFGAVLISCDDNADNPREFIVSFDSNGGSEVLPQTVREREKATKPEVNPILNGHAFVAWYKEVELSTEWKFDTDVVTANTTLYAGWIEDNADNPKEFIVSFDSNGGSEIPPQTVREGEKATKPEVGPTLQGHIFVAWYKEMELRTEWKFDTDVVTSDITLYAEWIDVDKETPEYSEFCLYANVEDFHKTTPIINEYLSILPKRMSDEQQLQALAEWLKTYPCIIDAVILCQSCIYTNPVMSEIMISFKENGITKELILDVVMTNPLRIAGVHEHYKPMQVFVKTKKDFTIDKVFDFINLLDFDVELIYHGVYVSTMPSENLQYILDCLNAKPYTNDGNAWWVTGYLHYLTNQITIFPNLYNMNNKEYQDDWLKSMNDYQLVEKMDYDHSGHIICFRVPEGTEKQWETQFKQYEFVEWTELNYVIHIIFGD